MLRQKFTHVSVKSAFSFFRTYFYPDSGYRKEPILKNHFTYPKALF
jgi:hypothetical protein